MCLHQCTPNLVIACVGIDAEGGSDPWQAEDGWFRQRLFEEIKRLDLEFVQRRVGRRGIPFSAAR